MARVGTRPAFDNMHSIAVRMRVVVDPAQLVLESDRVDDQRVALPLANPVSKKGGLDVLRVSAAVEGNGAERPHQLVKKYDTIGILNNLKGHAADAGSRDPGEQA